MSIKLLTYVLYLQYSISSCCLNHIYIIYCLNSNYNFFITAANSSSVYAPSFYVNLIPNVKSVEDENLHLLHFCCIYMYKLFTSFSFDGYSQNTISLYKKRSITHLCCAFNIFFAHISLTINAATSIAGIILPIRIFVSCSILVPIAIIITPPLPVISASIASVIYGPIKPASIVIAP